MRWCAVPFNLTDLPAILLPCDRDAHGMPIDMQRVADHRQEAKRLRAAHTWKQTTACLALSDEERWEPFRRASAQSDPVVSNLVEHDAQSTGVRSLSALCATLRGHPALVG